jgi:hypothetical protein
MRLPFRVLSKAASEAKAVDYGRDVGTISLAVFAEQDPAHPAETPNLLDDDGEDFAVIAANHFPKDPPENLGALKQALITTASRGVSRGLVDASTAQKADVTTVTFVPNPVPLLSASVTYYRP